MDLVCADGLFDDGGFPEGRLAGPVTGGDNLDFWAHDVDYAGSHSGNLGDATDPFDGLRFREFSPSSNPAALTGIGVFDIRRSGTRLSANLVRDTRHRSGIILADEVWRDSVIVVGDVFVAAQARLTISPGTVVLFETDSDGGGLDPDRSELVIDGTLIVGDDTSTRPVKFTSAAALPEPGDWYGIIVHFQGVIDMRNSVIEFARDGISGGGWSRVHELESVTIRETIRHGIHLVQMAKSLTLTGLEVSEAEAEGVRIQGTGPTVVRASRFTNNASSGFVRIGGSLQLLHSEFTDNGLGVVDGANLVVEGTVGRVTASQFSGGVGIRLSRSDNLVIDDNLFSRHQIGLLSLDSRPLIENNHLVANQLAVQIEGASVPVRVALNTVLDSDRFLDNRASTEVNAANNWWGFEDEIAIGQRMDGAVEWRPFLNVDPRLPLDLALMQNFPNPFNSGTTIEYTVGSAALKSGYHTVLDIWTVTGGLVRRLVDEPTLPGRHAVAWDGTGRQGHPVASSLYLYRLRVGSYTET